MVFDHILFTWACTLIPPALSPKMVTLSASPPNPTMFSLTHSMASAWSHKPWLVNIEKVKIISPHLVSADMPVAKVEESEPAQPIVDGDNNHVGFHQRARVVVMPGALEITDFKREYVFQVFESSYLNKGAAMNPDHHRHGLGRLHLWSEDIEVETVLHSDHLEKY